MIHVSERTSRFKIKNEQIEIEYEGSSEDVNERFSEVFEWIRSVPREEIKKKKMKKKIEETKEEEKKEEKRGGPRKAFISPKINELIEEGYFKLPNKRKVEDVKKTLIEKKGLPVTGKGVAVLEALKRRLGKTIVGTREEKTGEWVFWTE